jgi:hypothetical protein
MFGDGNRLFAGGEVTKLSAGFAFRIS